MTTTTDDEETELPQAYEKKKKFSVTKLKEWQRLACKRKAQRTSFFFGNVTRYSGHQIITKIFHLAKLP